METSSSTPTNFMFIAFIYVYYVQSIKDLDVILNHFDKYPLITKKHADYLLFKMAIDLIKNKEHLNQEGLRKLIALT